MEDRVLSVQVNFNSKGFLRFFIYEQEWKDVYEEDFLGNAKFRLWFHEEEWFIVNPNQIQDVHIQYSGMRNTPKMRKYRIELDTKS